MNTLQNPTRILRWPEVLRRTGQCKTGLHYAIKSGKFPAPIKINDDPTSRAVGFVEAEVEEYLAKRIAAARGEAA